MSRSRKRTPIMSACVCHSIKEFKKQEHRRYRAYVRSKIAKEEYDTIQDFAGQFCNEWDSPRDGKYWFGDYLKQECYHKYVCHMYGFTMVKDCEEDGHQWCREAYKKYMRK